MNYASLEDRAPAADALARTMLGFTITYTIGSRAYSIKAHGSMEDGTISLGTSAGIVQQVELMVLKTDLPVRPVKAHRVRITAKPGDIFEPVNVQDDDTGRHWLFNLKKVAA